MPLQQEINNKCLLYSELFLLLSEMLECSTENASKDNLELLRKDVPNNTLLRPFKISSKPISKKLFNIVVSGENISEDNGEIAKVTLNEAKLFCHIISKYLYDHL